MSSVLVFDSGIGGISVAHEIRALLPEIQIHYFCDNANLPYGEKSEIHLLETVPPILEKACDLLKPDILVLACNTASTLLLPVLRLQLDCQVVGVVPAIKPACQQSQSGKLALLATEATLTRDYTRNLIDEFASGCQVERVNASELVSVAESRMCGKQATIPEQLKQSRVLNDPNVDTIILGCTHFPLLKNELSASFPGIRYWVDSGEAIARRVQSLLQNPQYRQEQNKTGTTTGKTGSIAPAINQGHFLCTASNQYHHSLFKPLEFRQSEQISELAVK